MEEPLLSAVVANEAETSITRESLDGATRHPSLLGHPRVPGLGISISVPRRVVTKIVLSCAVTKPQPAPRAKTNTAVYKTWKSDPRLGRSVAARLSLFAAGCATA